MACAHALDRTPYAKAPNGHFKNGGGSNNDGSSDTTTELEESKEELDDEDLTRYYFYKSFQFKEICMFLQRKHGRRMSLRNLKKRPP